MTKIPPLAIKQCKNVAYSLNQFREQFPVALDEENRLKLGSITRPAINPSINPLPTAFFSYPQHFPRYCRNIRCKWPYSIKFLHSNVGPAID